MNKSYVLNFYQPYEKCQWKGKYMNTEKLLRTPRIEPKPFEWDSNSLPLRHELLMAAKRQNAIIPSNSHFISSWKWRSRLKVNFIIHLQ